MTALPEYLKLECPGLWRENPDAQRIEVGVSFGDATLVLTDRSGAALAHWSLAAVRPLGEPGPDGEVLFSPDADGAETLEIEDETMIAAIEKVRRAISRTRPRRWRLRLALAGTVIAGIVALAVFWLPAALVAHADRILPPEKRADLGLRLLRAAEPLTGAPCASPLGSPALKRLERRLFPDGRFGLLVLRQGVEGASLLPGGLIVLTDRLLVAADGPEAAAGWALVAADHAARTDPLIPILERVGTTNVLRLLTTGDLGDEVLAGQAAAAMANRPPLPDPDRILPLFDRAGIPSTPWAYAVDPSGETTLPYIEADPYRARGYAPLLSDLDWVALQEICEG